MSVNVDKLIEKYRKRHKHADRESLRTMIRQAYENDCLKRGFSNKREKDTWLRTLDNRLRKAFPTPVAKTKKTKTEEEIIWEFIKERYPNGAPLPLYSQTKYRPTFNMEETDLKDAAALSDNDYLDPIFRKRFFRLRREWSKKASLTTSK